MGWFLTKIQNLIRGRRNQILTYFDDIELELVIPRLLKSVRQIGPCQNVVWMTVNQFADFKKLEAGRFDAEPEKFTLRHLRLQSLEATQDRQVAEKLNPFSAALESTALCDNSDETVDLLAPIFDLRSKEPLAYILVIGVPKSRANAFKAKLDQELPIHARHIGFSLKHWESSRLSYVDDLTGLFNQKFMAMALENEIHRAQRENLKLSVLFMDFDFFKNINDTKGHLVGSRLLIELGRVLKMNLRRSDYAFRYGGDEYVVILPATSAAGASVAAERLRRIIEQTDFLIDGERIRLTLSTGIATFPDHAKTHHDILKMADEAMYCGKHKSRNVVFVAS